MYNSNRTEECLNVPTSSYLYTKPDLSHLSVNLTEVLNHIGFSEKHREGRVKLRTIIDMFGNVLTAVIVRGETCDLAMGSSIEGTTAPGMGSDMDNLTFPTSIKAYCNKADTRQRLGVAFIRDQITPPGYIKLEPGYQGCTFKGARNRFLGFDLWPINIQVDSNGRSMVTSFSYLSKVVVGMFDSKHGPAYSIKDRPRQPDQDIVRAFQCDDITNEMEEWCMRDRKHDWPSKETRDLFKTLGCFVVPVGHPSSLEKDLEWRMSFSLQERHLMWHLNTTQYHCFMLLKLIKVFLIKPQFGDVLTSYHCKTLLFYTIERHEQGIWIPKKLIECLNMCLVLLHKWIADKFIPNYFIPDDNMFVKMSAALNGNYDRLKSYVAEMCGNWMFLSLITFNDLEEYFYESIHGRQLVPCTNDTITPVLLNGTGSYLKKSLSTECDVYLNELLNISAYLDAVQVVIQSSQTTSKYNTFEETINELFKQRFRGRLVALGTAGRLHELTESFAFRVEDIDVQLRSLVVKALISDVQILLGSVFAAKYFQTGNEHYLMRSESCLELAQSLTPVCSMLVKATVLFKQSLFHASNGVLKTVEMKTKDAPFPCDCYRYRSFHGVAGLRNDVTRQPCDTSVFSNRQYNNCLSCRGCLYFKICEFDILPSPQTYEAYRLYGISSSSQIHFIQENWAYMTVVDPVMYLYYLQFLTNQHNNTGEAAVALDKFETTLFDRLVRSDWPVTTVCERRGASGWPGHTDTWFNVLGDIFAKKGWTRLALRCFKYSYKLWPLHNAVRWHIMFLLFSPTDCAV